MRPSNSICRREFLRTGMFGSVALATTGLSVNAVAGPAKVERDPFDGLKVGLTSYTWREFSLDQAIAMTKQVGAKYISLKEMHLPLKSTRIERQETSKKIADAGLSLLGCGVVYLKNDPEQIRNAFEYARDAGMPTITSSPDPDALDAVEKAAREFDIRVAIHNHGPGDKRYPSPLDVLRLVKDRDSRMGICMDVGHTVRLGQDPVEAIQQCAPRLYDFHMKDVTSAKPDGKATEVGKGIIDIAGVFKALLKLKWPYHVALEYEANGKAPLPGVTESFAYMRGILAAL